MADKITIAEAVNLANQDTAKLSNEQLTQMNEAFAESFFNRETLSDDAKIASEVTMAEIDARLKTLEQSQNAYDEKDLDGIIAMAESVGMFSQNSDVAKKVLDKAKLQKQTLEAQAKTQEAQTQQSQKPQTQEAQTAEEKPQENKKEEVKVNEEQAEEIEVGAETIAAAQEEVLSAEQEQALETAENTPEDQAELNNFDKENGVDKLTQEQLEANDKIIDAMPHPFEKDEQGNLKNPEFADEYKALQNMTITDDNGKELSEDEQNQDKHTLVYAAQLEAETYAKAAGNGNPEDVQKLYNQHFKDAIQRNIVVAAFASEVEKGATKEQIKEKFAQAVNNPVKATRSAVQAVTANSSAGVTKLKDRLKAKLKSIPVVQKIEARISDFDKSMTERYGKKYETSKKYAKIAWKSIKNVAVYSVVGATAGPVGLGALAAKSAYDSVKKIQKEAKANNMSFKEYAKANKAKVVLAFATTGLSLLGTAVGLGANAGIGGQESAEVLRPVLKTATKVLAIGGKAAPALWKTAKAGWKKFVKKDNEGAKEAWSKAKESWGRTGEAAAGIFIGSWLSGNSSAEEKVDAMTGANANQSMEVDAITGANVAQPHHIPDIQLEQTPDNNEQIQNHDAPSHDTPHHNSEPIHRETLDLSKMEGAEIDTSSTEIPDEINHVDMPTHSQGDMPTHQEIYDIAVELEQQYEQNGKIDFVNMMREQYANGEISEEKLRATTAIFNDIYDKNGGDVKATIDEIKEESFKAAQEEREAVMDAVQNPIINEERSDTPDNSNINEDGQQDLAGQEYQDQASQGMEPNVTDLDMPTHLEMYEAASEMEQQYEQNGKIDMSGYLKEQHAAGNMSEVKAQTMGSIFTDVYEQKGGNLGATLSEIKEESLKAAQEEYAAKSSVQVQEENIVDNTQEQSVPTSEGAEVKAEKELTLEERVNNFIAKKMQSGELSAEQGSKMGERMVQHLSQAESTQTQENVSSKEVNVQMNIAMRNRGNEY